MPRIPTAILIKQEEVDEVSQNEVDPAYPRVIRREVIEFPPIVEDPPSIASTFQEESESEVGLGLRNEIQEESLTVGEEVVHPFPTKIERTSDWSSSSQESLMEDNNSSPVSPSVAPVGSLIKLKDEGLCTSSLRNIKLERIMEKPFQNPFSRTSVNREPPLMLHKKSNSVVQTLLSRELSIAVFSRCGDYTCPLDLDVLIGRQLVRSRAPESNGKSVKPTKLDLHKKSRNNAKGPNGETWLQINVPDKAQIISVTEKLWLRATQGAADMGSVNEEFYSMEPCSGHGFKQLQTLQNENSSLGKLDQAIILNWWPITKDRTSTYVLTLSKSGHLRLYDICKRQVFHEIKLNRSGTARFTSCNYCDITGRIWVMATEKSVVKTILVLSYPPWKKVDVIHIQIPVMVSLCSQVCILRQGKTLKLTTWPYLIKKVQYTKRENRTWSPTNDLPVGFEGILSELPIIFSQSTLQQTDNCGFVNVLLPMFYGNYKTGIKFYLPFDNMRQPNEALYEFVVPSTYNVEDPIKVFPFPDESNRVLICSQYNYEVVSLKLNRKWKSVEVVQTSQPFNHWDHQTDLSDLSASTSDNAARKRPQRSCIKNQPRFSFNLNKRTVYGIEFNPHLNLLAVLTADDEEFQVVIYEPSTLNVFRSLPAVLAWPSVKGTGDVNPRRELVKPEEFSFGPEFIFVSFVYAGESKQHREAFFIRLLNELF